ncbi:MAG: hypothetical protein RR400_01085 [Clostridia bacterium]
MKKFLCFSLICLCGIGLSACGLFNPKLENFVSEICYNIFECDNSFFNCNITSGVRENPFEYDGKSEAMVPFCVVNVIFKKTEYKPGNNVPFKIFLQSETIEGLLEKNPFGEGYLFDIKRSLQNDAAVKIEIAESSLEQFDMVCKSKDWKVDHAEAFKIGSKLIKEKINENAKNGGEIYLKIIYDSHRVLKNHFWQFSFLDGSKKFSSVVIDVMTGEMLAKL